MWKSAIKENVKLLGKYKENRLRSLRYLHNTDKQMLFRYVQNSYIFMERDK